MELDLPLLVGTVLFFSAYHLIYRKVMLFFASAKKAQFFLTEAVTVHPMPKNPGWRGVRSRSKRTDWHKWYDHDKKRNVPCNRKQRNDHVKFADHKKKWSSKMIKSIDEWWWDEESFTKAVTTNEWEHVKEEKLDEPTENKKKKKKGQPKAKTKVVVIKDGQLKSRKSCKCERAEAVKARPSSSSASSDKPKPSMLGQPEQCEQHLPLVPKPAQVPPPARMCMIRDGTRDQRPHSVMVRVGMMWPPQPVPPQQRTSSSTPRPLKPRPMAPQPVQNRVPRVVQRVPRVVQPPPRPPTPQSGTEKNPVSGAMALSAASSKSASISAPPPVTSFSSSELFCMAKSLFDLALTKGSEETTGTESKA